jgi:hypothetical protein
LIEAAAEAGCDLHLALASIEESGSAEHTEYYGRRRWGRGGEDDANFEVSEIFDRSLILSEWRRPDGGAVGFRDFPFDEDELCPPDAFEDLTPDEQHFHEATGNEGASFDRTYSRAGFVLWLRARRLAVLNQAGLGATLPHLEDMATGWETGDDAVKAQSWREADELSGHMLRSWSRDTWRERGNADASRMLDLQARLRNAARIEEFLAELSAQGHYAGSDNEAIMKAAALLPRPRATELLVEIVRRNAAAHLGACGDLLLRGVAAPASSVDAAQVGAALVGVLPGDPAKRDPGVRPVSMTPDFVVDLLTATSRIDAGLAAQAIEHVLAWPRTYAPDDVLVPAALALSKLEERQAWPAAARLREAALDHLRGRIALPLEAPRDWSRLNPLECTCADCRELGEFLTDPHRRQWHLKAAQGRRSHVEGSVRNARCDIDFTTERRGSPHILVATKNQASYERRAKQRRQDLDHVSALGG